MYNLVEQTFHTTFLNETILPLTCVAFDLLQHCNSSSQRKAFLKGITKIYDSIFCQNYKLLLQTLSTFTEV